MGNLQDAPRIKSIPKSTLLPNEKPTAPSTPVDIVARVVTYVLDFHQVFEPSLRAREGRACSTHDCNAPDLCSGLSFNSKFDLPES